MKTYRVKDIEGREHERSSSRHYTHAVFARLNLATLQAALRGEYWRLKGLASQQLEASVMTRRWAQDKIGEMNVDQYVAANTPASLWCKPSFSGSLEIAERKVDLWRKKKHYGLKLPTYDQFDIVELVQP